MEVTFVVPFIFTLEARVERRLEVAIRHIPTTCYAYDDACQGTNTFNLSTLSWEFKVSAMETTTTSTVTIHMVCSVDGFIAKPDQSIEWLSVEDEYEDGIALTEEEITSFLASIDCYVMGSKTYAHALQLGWPYGDTPVICTQ